MVETIYFSNNFDYRGLFMCEQISWLPFLYPMQVLF